MSFSLVAFDTDRIKDYVFATSRLAEIRGASALLDDLNRSAILDEVCRVDKEAIKIYAHGGSGLFKVRSEHSQAIIKAVQKRYWKDTDTASITGVSVELPDDFNEQSDICSLRRTLSLRLRAAKDRNASSGICVSHSFMRPCDSCGVQYANNTYTEPDGQQALLCRSCSKKRDADHGIKREINKIVERLPPPHTERLWNRLLSELREAGYPFDKLSEPYRPKDFHALGNLSSPDNYLGLIYADGDSMGRELEQIKTLPEMEKFANGVDKAVYGAVKEAILTHLRPRYGTECLPFDVLLLGGDDLVMVTTAQAAIETALTIVDTFPQLTEKYYGKRLSLSASVILTHVNFPIRSLIDDLAASALKFAKTERAKRKEKDGLLNFLVVNSANHLDFKEYYNATLRTEQGKEILHRTLRPYKAADMRQLIETARDLSDAPRRKMQQLRSAVFQSRMQAIIDSLNTFLRWRNEEQRKTVYYFVKNFATMTDKPLLFPWVQRNGEYHTPILDLVELLDFIPKEVSQ